MSARASHFKLGLFILGAAAALGVFVVALGAGSLLRKRTYLETYFDASVHGLDVGSPVKYRGVTVGRISELTFTYAHYQQDRPLTERRHYVMVLASLRPELIGLRTGFDGQSLQVAIDNGLRVRSAPLGITGTNYLELDYLDPERNPPPPIEWEPKHLYIPTAPGTVAVITSAAEDIARRLQALDMEGLVGNLNRLALTANTTLERLPVGELGAATTRLVAELTETNRRVRALLADPALGALSRDAAAAASRLRQLAESPQLQRSLAQLGQTLQGLERAVGTQGGDVAVTLDNLRRMSQNLRDLSESLKDYPGQLLRGAPPAPDERR